jgi:hypothetical protein
VQHYVHLSTVYPYSLRFVSESLPLSLLARRRSVFDKRSGNQRLGHISKQGNSLLRFLLVEAAQAAVRHDPDWRRRYLHLAMRRERRIAKVAMARKVGVRLY